MATEEPALDEEFSTTLDSLGVIWADSSSEKGTVCITIGGYKTWKFQNQK